MIAGKLLAAPIVGAAILALSHVAFAQNAPVSPSNVQDVGNVVVDAAGMVLYTLSADTPGTGSSACYDDCAGTWPPVTFDGSLPGRSVIGTMQRTDGSIQLTWSGMPLYRYSGDVNPGDAMGDGLSDDAGTWSVIRVQ